MSISTSYLSNLYSNYGNILFNSNKYSSSSKSILTSLMNTKSSTSASDITDIAQRYTYLKKNYKDIKSSLLSNNKDSKTTSKDLEKTATSLTKEYVETKLSAGDLKDSIAKLSDANLFKEDKDGKVDQDKILSQVKEFVSSYNDLKNLAGESKSDTVVRQAYYMVNTTTSFKNVLDKVGINVKSDNTLSIDEDKFKKSSMNAVKALFTGSYSFGKQVEKRANEIKSAPEGGYLTYSNVSKDKNSLLNSYLSNFNTSLLDYFV